MSTPQNDGFKVLAPKPIDSRYLKNETTVWTSTTEVNTAIPSAYRYPGLTVLIGSIEYWYIGGTADGNLVPKNISNNSITLTITSDGFYTFPVATLVLNLMVTPTQGINFKAGSSSGAEDFVPTMFLPANQTTSIAVSLARNATQSIYFGGIVGSTTIVIKTL